MIIGPREFRLLRLISGKRQRDVAQALGYSQATISQFECGARKIRPEDAKALLEALKTPTPENGGGQVTLK